MTAAPVIETERLTKRYRHPLLPWKIHARAVTDLSLRIEPGEVFGLVGPNGSGKSTTIKLVLGLNFPTSGRVFVFGKNPRDLQARSRTGYLPEESYLYPYLNPAEILDFYGRLFSLAPAERKRRVEELLDFVGLRHQRHRPLGQFSKGMQRRVALAQSLINDPELVILDEPTSGMDPLGIAEIKDLVRELGRKGKTVVLSTHRLSDVEDLCDRVSILYGGREQVTGRVRDLIRKESVRRITAPVDDRTAQAIVELIRSRQGADAAVDVAPAEESLEACFLRVVRDAEARRLETSGSGRGGTAGLSFLTDSRRNREKEDR